MLTDRRMDGRTDMKKLIVAFQNFAKAPKIPEVDDMMPFLNPLLRSERVSIIHI